MIAHYIKLLTLSMVHAAIDVPLFVALSPAGTFSLVRTPTSLNQISHFDNEQMGEQLLQTVGYLLANMEFLTVTNPHQGTTVVYNKQHHPFVFDVNNYVMQRFRMSPEQHVY